MFQYSKTQLIAVPIVYVLMLIIAISLGYFLKDKKLNIKRIPIQVITIVLYVLEIVKQIYLIAVKHWSTLSLPFHFCSAFYIWFGIASFAKKEETQQIGYATSIIGSLVLWVLFLSNPSGIIGDAFDHVFDNYEFFHTTIFHILTMLMWLIIIALKLYKKPTNKTIIISTGSFLCFYVLATIMAFSLNANFISILFSNIPFMETLRTKGGQFVYDLVMYIIGIALPLAVLYGSKLIFILIENKRPLPKKKIKKKA